MASVVYNIYKSEALKGNIDLENDVLKVLLVNETHTPNPDNDFVSAVAADELSGTGYSRLTLTTKSVTEDDTNDKASFDFDDLAYTGINAGTINYAIVYKEVTTDADSILIVALDVANIVTNGSNVTLEVPVGGALDLT